MRRLLLVLFAATLAGLVLGMSRAGTDAAEAAPVASNATAYTLCGRVFPDPHAYWPSPVQAPFQSPYAKGNLTCKAFDFVTYGEMISGLQFLETLFPQFVEFIELEEDFGGNTNCATSTDPNDLCSAGLPRQGLTPGRVRSDLYMVRITDERVAETNKRYFVFPLSIHGIERAGAEAGVRAAEDLATWGYCQAKSKNEPVTPPAGGVAINCAQEGTPHRLLEAQPTGPSNLLAGDALKRSTIYFVFPNADGWRRGDPDNLFRFYQRYNGNGVDLNRDWPTIGFTHRPYTPWSEPETRGFGQVLKRIRPTWTGGIDLHGQLIDRAFSFTLLGASERNFAKNQRILQTVKGAWADAEQRLSWSPFIKPNDAPPQPTDPRMYGVQWGTVWDTINYTVTGDFGAWIDSPLGLNGDGIDNEMSMSHLSNCGIGSCYLTEFEQLHIDGNKSLIYAMVNYSLLPEDTKFRAPGDIAYVHNPKVLRNPGTPTPPPTAGLSPQPAIDAALSPTTTPRYTFEFVVKGPEDGFYNGGLEGAGTFTNFAGVSTGSLSSLVLERFADDGEPPIAEDAGCGAAGDDWAEVNRYFNQGSTYLQAGAAVHANQPSPGRYRICLTGGLAAAAAGVVDLDIRFSTEKTWADPGQLPYAVTNMKFFTDLRQFMPPGQLDGVTTYGITSGYKNIVPYTSLVIADDPMPQLVPPSPTQLTNWGWRLRQFVALGGNLVLTDGAIQNLVTMKILPAAAIRRVYAYAGYIGFTKDAGASDTYGDPLAHNVNQPGAAEGSGHRHQTYEPVPIGFDIGARTSCSGGPPPPGCTSPIWIVDQDAWEAIGGRTVGTSGTDRVSYGELKYGRGVIRIIGPLLPMPAQEYYHPFGLANYALTYSGYQVFNNSLQWLRPPLPPGDPVVVLSKTGPLTAKRGSAITYSLTYTNAGPAAAERSRITDVLPAGVSFVSASNGGTYNAATRTVSWYLGTVPTGASRTLTLSVRVGSTAPLGTTLVNRATFTGDLTVSPPTAVWATTVVP